MQVSFKGILSTYLASENSVQIQIPDKFEKARKIEDILNRTNENDKTYSDSEKIRIRLMAKKAIWDYREPSEFQDEEYNKQAGIYRLTARDAIYYCTGQDIEPAKELKRELKNKGASKEEKQAAIKAFVQERTKDGNWGFFTMDSTTGDRYDIFGVGESKKEKYFGTAFVKL